MIPSKEEFHQALVQRHGEQIQKQFDSASVAVCGLGGLGSNVAVHLARAGIGTLFLIDFDTVDISNLHRQQYFPDQLGQPKAKALSQTIQRIAPYCQVISETVRLTEKNIPELLASYTIICECFDKADQKAMLANCVLEHLPDAYLIASSGMAGLASANSIQTRKISKKFYLCGDGASDVEQEKTLFSARVAVCAGHQANTALRILAGEYNA